MGNKIGKQQIQTTQTLNELIKQSNEQTACGPDCQREKKISDLKSKYESTKNNLSQGPENLAEARKNYFVYAFGDKYNNDYNEKLYTKQASDKVNAMKKQHKEDVNEISSLIDDYESAYVYQGNMGDLSQKYEDENKGLKKEIDDNEKEKATNDRKVYYENQQIENIEYYKSLIKIVYWVTLILYTFVFLYDGFYKDLKMDAILILLYTYPYVIDKIVSKLFFVISYLKQYIPKNVYLNANSM